MSDDGIDVGDVVVDLASGQPLQVVRTAAQPAGEHEHTRSDETASLFGADPEEPVYDCVYLPTPDERISPPSKTYAYPESRLLRYPTAQPIAAASIQEEILARFLADLVEAADTGDVGVGAPLQEIVADVHSEELARVVGELVEASRGEQS